MNARIVPDTDHLEPVVALVRELYELAERQEDEKTKAIALKLYARITTARKAMGLPEYPIGFARPEGHA